jgi:hypothetical protein
VGVNGFIGFAGIRIFPSGDQNIELDIEEGFIKIKGDASITWEDPGTRDAFMRWLDGEPVPGSFKIYVLDEGKRS